MIRKVGLNSKGIFEKSARLGTILELMDVSREVRRDMPSRLADDLVATEIGAGASGSSGCERYTMSYNECEYAAMLCSHQRLTS